MTYTYTWVCLPLPLYTHTHTQTNTLSQAATHLNRIELEMPFVSAAVARLFVH